jgi:hypothetical protein
MCKCANERANVQMGNCANEQTNVQMSKWANKQITIGNMEINVQEPQKRHYYSLSTTICPSAHLHICTFSVYRIIINVDVCLGNLMGNYLYRSDFVVPVEIIRIEQSILFGKK